MTYCFAPCVSSLRAKSMWDPVTGSSLNGAVLYLMNYWYQYLDIESSGDIPRAKHRTTLHIDISASPSRKLKNDLASERHCRVYSAFRVSIYNWWSCFSSPKCFCAISDIIQEWACRINALQKKKKRKQIFSQLEIDYTSWATWC